MSDSLELEAATYWRLRFLAVDAELAEAHAVVRRQRLEAALAAAHVPVTGRWRWHDDSCLLTRERDEDHG